MVWLFIGFLALCALIALAPGDVVKGVLASAWVLMGLSAVGATLYAIGRAIL